MADPWLTIIGLGEDGLDGLGHASRDALARADIVMGATRHLALVPGLGERGVEWPVPWAEGGPLLMGWRGRARVVVLASGDPFWFGAGAVLVAGLEPGEWEALPGVSCFGLAVSRLGWALQDVVTLGLHASPLSRMRPHLASGARLLVLLRDGAAAADAAALLTGWGFGASRLHVLEALGGPRDRVRCGIARDGVPEDIAHPVLLGIEAVGDPALPLVPGLRDDWFGHDGQITKGPVRALTLAALAPRAGELLWDIGAGSGSVSIEWARAHPRCRAIGFERDATRSARARGNADALGVAGVTIVEGAAPDVLAGQPLPDAVFIGGGLGEALLRHLWGILPAGVRVVANAVTLESESLLAGWQARHGGALLRMELSEATPLGTRRGWRAAYPIVQWQGVR